jgi:hypothetical protein
VPDLLRFIWQNADVADPVVTADEITSWPADALGLFVTAGLLREAPNASALTCDACSADHVEEVVFLKEPQGTPLRAYLRCPEAGRVPVPLDRLRRWGVNYGRLAELVAAGLGTAGGVEEIIPGRTWLLGKTTLAAQSRDLFLVRCFSDADGTDRLEKSPRFAAATAPVVLVVGTMPPRALWPMERGPLLPLFPLVIWTGGSVEVDRGALDSALGTKKKKPTTPLASFPAPAGATWEEVRLTVGDLDLRVELDNVRRDFTFREAGFEDRRRGNVPDQMWVLLRGFAARGGTIPCDGKDLDARTRGNLKQNVSKLSKRLNALLNLEGSPFHSARRTRCYTTRFRIATAEPPHIDIPEGTTWDQISIAERAEGRLTISVDTADAVTIISGIDDESGRCQWEACQREGAVVRHCDLQGLGLAHPDGRPNHIGRTLLMVLRSGGKIQRPATDRAMLLLNRELTRLFQIKRSPFQFSESGNVWSALFEASSTIAEGSQS